MKSSSCCLISGCATCTTALQNSKQFMNSVNFGISATSSGVMRYQSLCPISKLFGSDEYRPPSPVTSTGHIDEYLAMYVPTFEFFCDNDMHSSNASRAWCPNEPSLCTYGSSNENMMKLRIINQNNENWIIQRITNKTLTWFHHFRADAVTLNRRIDRVNWHFALKLHTVDSIKSQAASPHPLGTWHPNWRWEFSAVDVKMIHARAAIDGANVWLIVHIASTAPAERHPSIYGGIEGRKI